VGDSIDLRFANTEADVRNDIVREEATLVDDAF
jgi:hypothetical protein